MNREIKFRAWHKGHQGSHILDAPIMLFDEKPGDCLRFLAQGQPVEVMQFTGLKDKNGVEIYENDIVVSFKKEYEDTPSTNTVRFTSGCWRLYCNGKNDVPLFNYIEKQIEVIGNIHQHPHLLTP